MNPSNQKQPFRSGGQGGLYLPAATADHLRAAMEQTELLLSTSRVERGLRHLLALLHHLREVQREIG
ncbi:MAG: hypothetical protein ACLFVW_08915 [Phycisphaerae bacterium]